MYMIFLKIQLDNIKMLEKGLKTESGQTKTGDRSFVVFTENLKF